MLLLPGTRYPGLSIFFLLNSLQRFQPTFPGERHPEQPCSGCVEYRVSDCSSDSNNRRLTSTLGCLVLPVKYYTISFRHPRKPWNLIAVEIPVEAFASLEFEFLGESITERHSYTAFHLDQGTLRIYT